MYKRRHFPFLHGDTRSVTGPVRDCLRTHVRAGYFVGDVMTTSMLYSPLKTPRVSPSQSVRAATGPRACAEIDAFAATLGPAESSENVMTNVWSSDINKLVFVSFSLLFVLAVYQYHGFLR